MSSCQGWRMSFDLIMKLKTDTLLLGREIRCRKSVFSFCLWPGLSGCSWVSHRGFVLQMYFETLLVVKLPSHLWSFNRRNLNMDWCWIWDSPYNWKRSCFITHVHNMEGTASPRAAEPKQCWLKNAYIIFCGWTLSQKALQRKCERSTESIAGVTPLAHVKEAHYMAGQAPWPRRCSSRQISLLWLGLSLDV